MDKSELRKIAIKHLNTKKVQSIKKGFAKQITDKKERREFEIGFDKGFIKSFISTRRNHM
jgi:hypothetical protein